MEINGDEAGELMRLHSALVAVSTADEQSLRGLGCVLHQRGERAEDVESLAHLLDEMTPADLAVALTSGVGWDAVCDLMHDAGPDLPRDAQQALAVLHHHGGDAPQALLRAVLNTGPELARVRQGLEGAGLIRVVPRGRGKSVRWVVPVRAAQVAAVAAAAVPPIQHSQELDDWHHVPLSDYIDIRRFLMRRLERAERHDADAVATIIAMTPSAVAHGDAWLVYRLCRRHLGLTGDAGDLLRASAARLAWSSGSPELARTTLGVQSGGVDVTTIAMVDALIRQHPNPAAHHQALLDLVTRASERSCGPVAAMAVVDGAIHAAHAGRLEDSKRLVAEAHWLALGSDEQYLTGRCCLAEALLNAVQGENDVAARYADVAMQMLVQYGDEVVVNGLVETMSPALLSESDHRNLARHLAVGYVGGHCAITQGWGLLAVHNTGGEVAHLVDTGTRIDLPTLLTASRTGFHPQAVQEVFTEEQRPRPSGYSSTEPAEALTRQRSGEASGGVAPSCKTAANLTSREHQVAELVADGLTNEQVARRLGISRWTAVNHLRNVMRKLDCVTRVEVAARIFAAQTAMNTSSSPCDHHSGGVGAGVGQQPRNVGGLSVVAMA